MSTTEITLYLIRHATPDFNRPDLVYYLPPGPPLTPKGEQEALALAAYLKETRVGALYSSPLERCLRTAQAAGQATGLAVSVESGLAEVRPGESAEALRARVWPVCEKAMLVSLLSQQPAALFTHGAPVNLLLKDLGMEEAVIAGYRRQFDHANPLPPAGVWKATRLAHSGSWRLELAFMPAAEPVIL